MSINTGELRRQLRKLTIHPDQHDQGLWAKAITEDNTAPRQSACDTFGCLAGNTVLASGQQLYWSNPVETYTAEGKEAFAWEANYVANSDGSPGRYIRDEAQELLGLSESQARMIFDGSNTRDDLWHFAIEFTANTLYPITLRDYVQAVSEAKEVAKEKAAEAKVKAEKAAALKKAEDELTLLRAAHPELYRSVDEAATKKEDKEKAEKAAQLQRLQEHANSLLTQMRENMYDAPRYRTYGW